MKKKSLENPAAKKTSAGTLFVCATPLGNLEDVSYRLLRVLKEADLIVAEDTRVTQKLLSHFHIRKPLLSYSNYQEKGPTERILERLAAGEKVALVSDAGTPGISDPGYYLIKHALEKNFKLVAIPGPSALITALSVSGLPTDRFIFEGFLPRKEKELKEFLATLKQEKRTLIFYEAPHRLLDTLKALHSSLGDREICIARELTKLYEEYFRGTLAKAVGHFEKIVPRGEFTLIVSGNRVENTADIEDLKALMLDLLKAGVSKKDISRILSAHFKLPKNKMYAELLALEQK